MFEQIIATLFFGPIVLFSLFMVLGAFIFREESVETRIGTGIFFWFFGLAGIFLLGKALGL